MGLRAEFRRGYNAAMPIHIECVVSGGQTGVDQAALRAARACGIATGGWAPNGWLTEVGPAPWLADYGLIEFLEPGYPARTSANARDSDATLWLGSTESSGYRATAAACRKWGRPMHVVEPGELPGVALAWLGTVEDLGILNVAGNRESVSPGIGARAERWLAALFRRITGSCSGP